MTADLLSRNEGSFSGGIASEEVLRPSALRSPEKNAARKSSTPMSSLWKVFGAAHKSIYLGSGGRLGSKLLWMPMLLLSTRGRRTGLVRTMPLAFLPDPEDSDTFVIVASNGGSERPPAWWLNLSANRIATVQVGEESFWAEATLAPPERRAALWKALRKRIPPYRAYERIDREIPIVLLRRVPAEVSIPDAVGEVEREGAG